MRVLLSIRPEHVDNILNGAKRYEFRRKLFSRDVSDVVIYCTKPVGKIVAEFSIAQVLEDRPELIWRKTAAASGISKEYFDSYFQGRDKAFAIEIGNLLVYNYPVAPEDVIQNFTAPQSYRYLPAAGINPQMELAV